MKLRLFNIITLILLSFPSICIYGASSGWVITYHGGANLVSINFIDANTGFMFRRDKFLFKTTNKGQSWDSSYINNGPGNLISQGSFYDNNVGGYISGPFNTTNGGSNWIHSNPPALGSLFMQDILVYNETTSFLSAIDVNILDASVDPVIFKSTNSGLNWTEVDRGGGANNYADMIFINDNTGFQCRFSVLKTTNGGTNWGLFSETFRQHTAFSQVFGDTMYMSSANGYISKSINLGANWSEYYTGINQLLTDVYFVNNSLGYAIGDTGGIVKTTNGGVNWSIQNSGTTRRLNEVWFLNADTGFIAGDSGMLLVTYNGGVTSVSQTNHSIPGTFKLYQNYPNPFNPYTLIKFDIARSTDVSIVIYDIIGKEIQVLVNERLEPGSYEYEFTVEGLPSGVYFYRLLAGSYIETRRMVLVK